MGGDIQAFAARPFPKAGGSDACSDRSPEDYRHSILNHDDLKGGNAHGEHSPGEAT